MKIRSTLFGALLLCAALVVPTSADTADQGKSKDKKQKQEQQQSQSEERATERGKQKTDQDDREPDPARDDNDRDTPGGDAIRMQALDTDGDGRITRAEWRGNDTSFSQHDKNGDGVLAGAEITPGEPLTDNEEALNDWQEWWDFRQGQFDTDDFDGMDKDENQSVSREEWAGSFALFDRDHNGMISQQEYEDREYRGMTREALFGKMDTNGNGRLEPSEWWWSRETFALVDRDSNGWVTPDELMHRGEPQSR